MPKDAGSQNQQDQVGPEQEEQEELTYPQGTVVVDGVVYIPTGDPRDPSYVPIVDTPDAHEASQAGGPGYQPMPGDVRRVRA